MQKAHLKKRRLPKQKVRDMSPFLVSVRMGVGPLECGSDERLVGKEQGEHQEWAPFKLKLCV